MNQNAFDEIKRNQSSYYQTFLLFIRAEIEILLTTHEQLLLYNLFDVLTTSVSNMASDSLYVNAILKKATRGVETST